MTREEAKKELRSNISFSEAMESNGCLIDEIYDEFENRYNQLLEAHNALADEVYRKKDFINPDYVLKLEQSIENRNCNKSGWGRYISAMRWEQI